MMGILAQAREMMGGRSPIPAMSPGKTASPFHSPLPTRPAQKNAKEQCLTPFLFSDGQLLLHAIVIRKQRIEDAPTVFFGKQWIGCVLGVARQFWKRAMPTSRKEDSSKRK